MTDSTFVPHGRLSGRGGVPASDGSVVEEPLGAGPRAIWTAQRLDRQSPSYHIARAVRMCGPVDADAVRRTIQRLADRHPNLRCAIVERDGQPVRLVHERMPADMRVIDASGWSEERMSDAVSDAVAEPFDLARGPLFRARLWQRSPEESIGLLIMHHVITDLWSLAVVLYEYDAIYREEVSGGAEPAKLYPQVEAYTDHVRRQDAFVASPEGEEERRYWAEELAVNLPPMALPTDLPRPPMLSGDATVRTERIDADLTGRLKALARAQGVPLHALALAAFQTLLHHYCGQDDVVVGSPVAGRSARVANLVGYFVNPVVLRAGFHDDPSFEAFLARSRETVARAHAHASYPFTLLAEWLQPERDPNRPPLFQVMFAWQKTTRLLDLDGFTALALQEPGGALALGGVPCVTFPIVRQVGPLDLTLLMAEADGQILVSVDFSRDLFAADFGERFHRHYRTLLEAIVADPAVPVSRLSLLPRDERSLVVGDWNRTDRPLADPRGVHALVAEQAERRPDAPAVVEVGGETLTYRELWDRASALARRLRALGVGPDARVGLCVDRSAAMVVGVLGILEAGGAYVPLDPQYPAARLRYMLGDCGATVLVTQAALLERLPELPGDVRVVRLDEPDAEPAAAVSGAAAGPEHAAYVIYTSGSTGRPKGVEIEHRGLRNLVAAQTRGFGVTETDRVLQFASLSFDASASEIFMALATGAALVVAPPEALLPGAPLRSTLNDQGITVVTLPPSVLGLYEPDDLPALRTVITAGERCPVEVAARWAATRRLFNAYGPTETTIGPTFALVTPEMLGGGRVPIGRPIANMRAYVLNRAGQPVPIGLPGELHVGGVGVARGYVNLPELTAQKFVPDPFSAEPGARLYRTGDRVRWRTDGQLEFLGRMDEQVKLRGFRIETGEIESLLAEHRGVTRAAAVVRSDGDEDPYLAAYVEPAGAPAETELKAYLRGRLPAYMVPSVVVAMETLPRLPNGKIDRQALPVPDRRRAGPSEAVAPRTDLEEAIAAIWREELKVERVGIHDNFFDLGGHSLIAARVHERLEALSGRTLPMVELFRFPTVGLLAEHLSGNGGAATMDESRTRGRRQLAALAAHRQALSARRRGGPADDDEGGLG